MKKRMRNTGLDNIHTAGYMIKQLVSYILIILNRYHRNFTSKIILVIYYKKNSN